jgi:hypothetical protein
MNIVYLVRNDNGPQVRTVLTREDTGLPVDLRESTVKLKLKKAGTSAVIAEITAMTLSDFLNGEALFLFDSTVLANPAGQYKAEIEAAFDNGNIETVYDELALILRDDY